MTLQQIGLATGTDKARHVHNGESYLDVYALYLEPLRRKAARVVEFGVLSGSSLRMWEQYFENAEIYGVDINPAVNTPYGPRISVTTANQTDAAILSTVAAGNSFDVIVDDASHVIDHMLRTFEIMWPRLSPGGVYIMEDLGNSYVDLRPYHKDWPGQQLNPIDELGHKRETFEKFVQGIVRDVDSHNNQLRSVHFWPHRCVFLKV